MKLKVRRSNSNEWGFVESFSTYSYDNKGTINVTVVVTPEGKLAKPYVFRGGEFVPLDEIKDTIGVDKYIKAKKPFYCKIKDGFIATIKAGYNFKTGEFLPEKTSYSIYEITNVSSVDLNKGEVVLRRILELSEISNSLMLDVARDVVKTGGDREAYLLSRL